MSHGSAVKLGLTEADKSVLLSSYAFDLGYTAIFPILQAGGELHIVPKETYTAPDQLGEYIQKNGITYMKLTPSLFHMIVNTARFTSERRFSPLRLVVLGGEKIITSDVRKFHDVYAHTDFINHYGPTETTIGAIAERINMERLDQYEQRPVIGRPIANTERACIGRSNAARSSGRKRRALYYREGACQRISSPSAADGGEISLKSFFTGQPDVQNGRCRPQAS